MTVHVPMVSGGITSWWTSKLVADQHGADNVVLLFADTLVEDDDTYRFLRDAASNVIGDSNGRLVVVKDGRTPFEVFHDDRFLGNNRLANCSKYLKQKPCRAWLEANCDPADTILYVGIDWTETHRIPAIVNGWAPWRVEAPLCDPPYYAKLQLVEYARAEGIEPPSAYAEGFPHANCGAQGCVRGGQAYWQMLLEQRPEVYARTEAEEEHIRATDWGANATILRDRRGGDTTPMTLREFRHRLQSQPSMFDSDEWGGCGCFTDGQGDAA